MPLMSSKWVFTLNNPTELIDDVFDDSNGTVRFLCYSEETGDAGNYHFQGVIHLNRSQRLSYLRKLIPRAHFEQQRGTDAEAIAYCKKEGDPSLIHEMGMPIGEKGQRNDFLMIKKKIEDGIDVESIAKDNNHFSTWLRYNKSLVAYKQLVAKKRTEIHTVMVVYGPPGTGKTTWVNSEFTEIYWAARPNNGSFYFEGYRGEDCILVDDFYGWYPQDFLLRLCQHFECRLPYRGGESQCLARNIIFTSNKRPWNWYKNTMANFIRRVTHWVYFYADRAYYITPDFIRFQNEVLRYEFIVPGIVNYPPGQPPPLPPPQLPNPAIV